MTGHRFPVALVCLATIVAVSSAVVAGRAEAAPPRPLGDVRVLATVPTPPGFPEGIAIDRHTAYVSGPARFGTAGDGQPSTVHAFDTRTGELVETFEIAGENLAFDHANSCLALDHDGRLYVLNLQLGVVRIDPKDGTQDLYASPVPDLPSCSAAVPPCSPTFLDIPPLANDLAFAEDGTLYITDSFQATIWQVPAGGGAPEIWFQDSRLDTPFGANGLRLSPERDRLFFSVSADGVGPGGVFLGGTLYSLPLVETPVASDLDTFHTYNGEGPDGIAFGRDGDLYVALAAPFNSAISILGPDGVEKARLVNTGGPLFPFDSPANLAFDGQRSLLVTNHAFLTGIPSNFTVLDVYVGDKGDRLEEPKL